MCSPVKKTYVRFFFKSHLFSDGYRVVEGDSILTDPEVPDLEVKSRELSNLDFWIPNNTIGFILYDIITTQVEDNGRMVELTSGEINRSGRYFFQTGENGLDCGRYFGRVAIRDEASREWDRQTYMRRYCLQPTPEKIILYSGPRDDRFLERRYHICTFDFLETDALVPLLWVFPSGHMIKTAKKAA